MKQRFEGRNLEEALAAAASALGVESYQLDYHVAVEKRGFLGGMKRIVIEAEADEGRQPESNQSRDAQMLAASDLAAPATETPRRDSRGGGSGRRERGRGGRGRDSRGDSRGGRGGERPQRSSAPRKRVATEPAPEQGERGGFATAVGEWCERLVDHAGFALDVRTFEDDPNRLVVRFYGADADLLTDKGGSLLDSIQVLATKAFSEKEGAVDIEMDVAGFKEQRASELEARALELAGEVRADGRERVMNPMSPVERRLVHLALADDADVETVSRGDGFLKRVVVRRRRPQADDATSSGE